MLFMWNLIENVLAPHQYMPHGYCYLWQTPLVVLHIVSDLLIAIAYFSITTMLVYFVCKRQDIPFLRVLILFGLFIISCGIGHILDVWTLWYPAYWLSGIERAITALVSCYTAIELVTLLPLFLALKTPEQLAAVEAANQAKSDFLANMSHELRTPLNSILGFTQLISRTSILSTQSQGYINIIHQSGQHLLTLINDILEMSKIEAGRTTLNLNPFNLSHLLNPLEEMLSFSAKEKGLQFIFDLDPQLPQQIQTDEKKLRQVLINLLSNAIKFTDFGQVILRVKILDLENTPVSSARLQFEVEDTGQGIAPEEIEGLFQPFTQTTSGLKIEKGTGLGLSISQEFVRLMGGEIKVESQLDQGTKFYFDIPVTIINIDPVKPIKTHRSILHLAPHQPDYHILVAEDDYQNRFFLMELLISVGYNVRGVCNGQEAVRQWSIWQPDLILMDIRMPIMNGYEAIRKIQAESQEQLPILIALTAHVFEEEQQQIKSAGFNDFIRKPFQPEELLTTIGHYLKLQYVYTEETREGSDPIPNQQDNDSMLRAMPKEWIDSLEESATKCSDILVYQLIQQIPKEYFSLARTLTELTEAFRFDLITDLIQSSQFIEEK